MSEFQEEIVAQRTVFQGRKFTVVERDIQVTPDKVVTWEVLDKGWDSVAIVAIDDERKVHLVEEYFGGTNERTLCLPKGKIDPGETPLQAAGRELREEIGLGGKLSHLGTFSVSPGYLTQRTVLFLATELYPDALEGDEVQFIQPTVLSLDTAVQMCLGGEITEARTIAALLMAVQLETTETR
jgi:ADP-ribose diphosphatase